MNAEMMDLTHNINSGILGENPEILGIRYAVFCAVQERNTFKEISKKVINIYGR